MVYGSNWQKDREELWTDLVQINQQFIDGSWVVLADFNTARFYDGKIRRKAAYFF